MTIKLFSINNSKDIKNKIIELMLNVDYII